MSSGFQRKIITAKIVLVLFQVILKLFSYNLLAGMVLPCLLFISVFLSVLDVSGINRESVTGIEEFMNFFFKFFNLQEQFDKTDDDADVIIQTFVKISLIFAAADFVIDSLLKIWTGKGLTFSFKHHTLFGFFIITLLFLLSVFSVLWYPPDGDVLGFILVLFIFWIIAVGAFFIRRIILGFSGVLGSIKDSQIVVN